MESKVKVAALLATGAMLVVLLTPAMSAGAPAVSASSDVAASASGQWAYGGQRWVNVSATLPNGTFSESAFFGWHVIFTATNTSATTVALEAQRVMAAALFIQYCSPSCSSPARSGNVSIVGWEKDVGFANLTSAASVNVNGSGVPAIGILNASSQSASRLNESYSLAWMLGSLSRSASAALTYAGHSQSSASFAPAFGLVPLNLSTNLSWSSATAYSAQASWADAFSYDLQGPAGHNLSGSGAPGGNLSGSGNLSLVGTDLGNVTLRNGVTAPVVAIQVAGPFDDVDGVILIPHGYSAFGPGVHAWDAHAIGAATVGTSRLDVFVDASHHLRLEAAASTYGTANNMLTVTGAPTSPTAAVSAQASPAASPGALVQAQPESVAQAQQGQHCLSVSCSTLSPAGAPVFGVVILVGLIAVVVVGSIAVVSWKVRTGARSRLLQPGLPPPGAYSPPLANLPPPPPPSAPPTPPQEPPRI